MLVQPGVQKLFIQPRLERHDCCFLERVKTSLQYKAMLRSNILFPHRLWILFCCCMFFKLQTTLCDQTCRLWKIMEHLNSMLFYALKTLCTLLSAWPNSVSQQFWQQHRIIRWATHIRNIGVDGGQIESLTLWRLRFIQGMNLACQNSEAWFLGTSHRGKNISKNAGFHRLCSLFHYIPLQLWLQRLGPHPVEKKM